MRAILDLVDLINKSVSLLEIYYIEFSLYFMKMYSITKPILIFLYKNINFDLILKLLNFGRITLRDENRR